MLHPRPLQRYFCVAILSVLVTFVLTILWIKKVQYERSTGMVLIPRIEIDFLGRQKGKCDLSVAHMQILETLKNNTQIVLVEPRFLLPLIPPEKRHRISLESSSLWITSFVATPQAINDLLPKGGVGGRLKQLGFTSTVLFGEPLKSDNVTKSPQATHLFYLKHGHMFHIMPLFKRDSVLWISPLNESEMESKGLPHPARNLLFSGRESILERFRVQHANICGTQTVVPENPLIFLSDVQTSTFISCNVSVAKEFRTLFPEAAKPNEVNKKKFKKAIADMKAILNPLGVPFWLSSGTLLGWYRQCDVIPYTTDMDLSMWINDYSPDIMIQILRQDRIIRFDRIWGRIDKAFQMVFSIEGWKVDLFFIYEEADHFWEGIHLSPKAFFQAKYPKYTLCASELFGEKVLVPCEPEKVIVAEYGTKWTSPMKVWSYVSSPRNAGPIIHWDKLRTIPTPPSYELDL